GENLAQSAWIRGYLGRATGKGTQDGRDSDRDTHPRPAFLSCGGMIRAIRAIRASARATRHDHESRRAGLRRLPGFERLQRGPDRGPGRRRHRVQGLEAVARVDDDRFRARVEHAVGEQPAKYPEGHPGCRLAEDSLGRGEHAYGIDYFRVADVSD